MNELWSKCDIYINQIKEYENKVVQTTKIHKPTKELYSFIKQISPEFFVDEQMHPAYNFIREYLILYETTQLANHYISQITPEFNMYNNKVLSFLNPNDTLDYIVHQVRKQLILKHTLNKNFPLNIKYFDFADDCPFASEQVQKICNSLNIESHIITIHPGYKEEAELYNGSGYHMCNIIKLNNQYHLIDCTYRQFFALKQNFLERIGIVNISGCRPGRFMLMDNNRKQVANTILKDGWITLTDNTLKHYLDGFTLSFRNGSYYENTGDFSYTTPYSVEDYVNFLSGKDNQINHEGKENLGYQKKPLKNPNLNFRKAKP